MQKYSFVLCLLGLDCAFGLLLIIIIYSSEIPQVLQIFASFEMRMRKSIIQYIESFLSATKSLKSNILRTVLSLLGVTVGIFLIITVLSAVSSLESGIKSSFDMIGDDVLFIQKWPMGPEDGDEEYAWWKYMSRRQPVPKDLYELEARLTYAQAVGYQTQSSKTAQYLNNYMDNAVAMGISYRYKDVVGIKLQFGRYFTVDECEGGRSVAIIGSTVSEQLFGTGQAIGKKIKVGGLKVEIIGVFEKEGASLLQNGFDQVIAMPVNFTGRLFNVKESECSIIVKAKEGVANQALKDEVISTMRGIRRLKPKQDNDFSVIKATMIGAFIDSVFGIISSFGFGIGLVSIFVGAFGIVNIMFVSVKERTKEIGIQKALGAKRVFILLQFLFESVVLCLIGGVIGLLLVYLVMVGISYATELEFFLSWDNASMGLLISIIVGVISGIIPAWRASRLDPVDAMRF
jgi:putative ABC transport system permease protein